jgi:hypothetical protein
MERIGGEIEIDQILGHVEILPWYAGRLPARAAYWPAAPGRVASSLTRLSEYSEIPHRMRGHDGKRPTRHPATSARDVLHPRLQPPGPRPQRFPLRAQPCDLRAQPIHPCPQAKNSEVQG